MSPREIIDSWVEEACRAFPNMLDNFNAASNERVTDRGITYEKHYPYGNELFVVVAWDNDGVIEVYAQEE